MTTGLSGMFDACRREGRSALIGYLPTGYPDVPTSISAMTALVESGCDIVEVGMPYSDPGMDGPTIATATEAALRGGVRVRDSLAAVEAISKAGGRAVVMTYWNLVLHYGVDAFARDLASAGGLGMITPDLIPDEAARMAGGVRCARPGPHLPGGAVVDPRAAGRDGQGVARIRLRGFDDGRDGRAGRGVEGRARIGQPGQGGVGYSGRRRAGGEVARAGRPDRCVRRRCNRWFGPGVGAEEGLPAVRALTEELADGVRQRITA